MAEAGQTPQFEMVPSRMFPNWLAGTGGSVAFTTYQANKLFLIGSNKQTGRLSIFERTFPRCMGMGVGDNKFWISSLYQLWRFENFLDAGQLSDGYDGVFVPVEGKTTGDVDVHDVHPYGDGESPIFVVTRFNCLATHDPQYSFRPLWMPPFIDRIAAEDRCHLNGLAMERGQPAYVTCVGRSNVEGGWRDHRENGGLLLNVPDGDVIVSGLSMPHSPRVHNGELYMLQSGTGEFGRVDRKAGKFEPMCFLPGFARGVSFFGNHAIIGVSRPRKDRTFEGLALQDRLAQNGIEARCQIVVVNLTSGDVEHSLSMNGVVQELYDVQALPALTRPMALGFKTDEIRFMIRPGGPMMGTEGQS